MLLIRVRDCTGGAQACLNQEARCGGGSLISRRLLRSESGWLSYCCSRLACSPLSRCYLRGWKYLEGIEPLIASFLASKSAHAMDHIARTSDRSKPIRHVGF